MSEQVSLRTLWDVKVPMRDGVVLSTDIYLPEESVEGPYPAILMRTPYDNTTKPYVDSAKFFASNGYAFIIQDVRGRCDSDGVWVPFFNEGPDGYDTIEWIAKQPWCNGKVAMMGGSYGGWVQWAAAREKPPHLTTMVSTASGGYFMKELPFMNGIPSLEMLGWLHLVGGRTVQVDFISGQSLPVNWRKVFYHLPLKTMDEALGRTNTVWREWLSHPNLDEYWKRVLFRPDDFTKINIPVLHITGWYDGDQPGALFFYDGMVNYSPAKDKQYLIIGPWDHAGTRFPRRELGGVDFTNEALMDMSKVHLEWFDYWLKNKQNEVAKWKRLKYFVMGANKWSEENQTWPTKDTDQISYYLHSNGKANTLMGDGSLSTKKPEDETPDMYIYNPENPVIAVMDFDFYASKVETPLDNRFILRRDDVLVYTSEAFEKEIIIAGKPIMILHASSNCLDTDWFVQLSDVYPDERSILLCSGCLRARFRNSLEFPELMSPGNIYNFIIELDSTCVAIKKEHRIRLAITSSMFPVFARNQNTGNDISEDDEIRIAKNTVYHSKDNPSHLILPIKKR